MSGLFDHSEPSAVLDFVIDQESAGVRLDVFLGSRSSTYSRSHFKRMIQQGLVKVNSGSVTKPGFELRAGDHVIVSLPVLTGTQPALQPVLLPLHILYEDEDILVLNKAPGMVVHPGAGEEEATLVHALLAHCPHLALQGAPRRPGIVHRLDKDTSGAMVVAKSERAYLRLIDLFKNHEVEKVYLALAYGRFRNGTGEIRTLLDRHATDRKRMAVSENKGREALSRWEVQKEYLEVSLLKVRIQTGRTHQIRVHLSHLQHPLVGDETYGGGRRRLHAVKNEALRRILAKVERQLLHAAILGFPHPLLGHHMSFEAQPGEDFQGILDELDALIQYPLET